MLTINQMPTDLYTTVNYGNPNFKAGKSNDVLHKSTSILEKEIGASRRIATATEATPKSLVKRFLNIFKKHNNSVNNIHNNTTEKPKTHNYPLNPFVKVQSPIGELRLSPKGIKQYFKAKKLYDKGYASDVVNAELKMEVLRSFGEYSTKYNDTIKSETFGKIKVTEKGLKQYLGIIDLYSKNVVWKEFFDRYYPSIRQNKKKFIERANTAVIEAEQKINILKAYGEL